MFTKITLALTFLFVAASGALAVTKQQSLAPHGTYGAYFGSDALYDEACHSSHAVFACPGSGGN